MVADGSGDDKKKKVVVVKKDDSGKEIGNDKDTQTIKVKSEEKNLAPLAGPMEAEQDETVIATPKDGGANKTTEVVMPEEEKDLAPMGGQGVLDGNTSTKSDHSSYKPSTHKSEPKPADKSIFDRPSDKSVSATSVEKQASADRPISDNKTSASADKLAPGSKGSSEGKGSSADKVALAGLAYPGSKDTKKCAKCSKETKECRCLSDTPGDSHVVIDESKNKSHRVAGDTKAAAYAPAVLEAPVPESILCELRRKNSVVAEGFAFKKHGFFFCFWVKKYFVLLSTGELLWLERDGSGPGYGNWNAKRGTAFNKFDYEGYSHAHRFTFSSESSTCYLAFDTEVERNYWLEKLQDASRA